MSFMTGFTAEDPRVQTLASRMHIGFIDDPAEWKAAEAVFGDGSLEILGHPVMEDWETPYMRDLAAIATRNGGTILEIGFGMGISANFIQKQDISEHIVIEANQDVFQSLRKFSKYSRKPVRPLFGLWQDVIDRIAPNSVDGILFDTYPLTVEEIHCNHFPFFSHACRILKPGGVLTYYSDEIDSFSSRHLETLTKAGFTQISFELSQVTPPKDCLYWTSSSILAPIVVKE
jgi:guanidinoacetate N-methyltransferase